MNVYEFRWNELEVRCGMGLSIAKSVTIRLSVDALQGELRSSTEVK